MYLILNMTWENVQRIFAGQKTWELRKIFLSNIQKESKNVLMYVAKPLHSVVGLMTVQYVRTECNNEDGRNTLWTEMGNDAGMSKAEFDAFAASSNTGTLYALKISQAVEFPTKLCMSNNPMFQAPSTHTRLRDKQAKWIISQAGGIVPT